MRGGLLRDDTTSTTVDWMDAAVVVVLVEYVDIGTR